MEAPEFTPHRSALRAGRVSIPGQAYFVTKCTLPAVAAMLLRPECAAVVIQSLLWARNHGWWRILGFVVMPGHYHLALGLGEEKTLSDAMGGVDKFLGLRLNRMLGRAGPFWEEGFHDHAIRDRIDFDAILASVHANPVKAGLVSTAEDWPFSTAHADHAGEIDWEYLGVSMPKAIQGARRFRPEEVPMRYR